MAQLARNPAKNPAKYQAKYLEGSVISIYEFDTLSDYLNGVGKDLFQFQPHMPPSAKGAVWSRRLGYRSPRTVGMVLEGRRPPSRDLLERLSELLRHDVNEHRYLEILGALSRNPSEEKYLRKLNELRPLKKACRVLKSNEVIYLSHWYHFVVKQLIRSGKVAADAQSLAARFRGRVTPDQVQRSLDRMESLGLLKRSPLGDQLDVAEPSVTTTEDVPTEAIRLHHREQLARANEMLQNCPVEEREYYALTLGFSPDRMNEAKRFIRQFMEEFDRRFCRTDSPAVYQCNLQFFPQTKGIE